MPTFRTLSTRTQMALAQLSFDVCRRQVYDISLFTYAKSSLY